MSIERAVLKNMNFTNGTDHFVARHMLRITKDNNGNRKKSWREIMASWIDTGKGRSAYHKRKLFDSVYVQYIDGAFDNKL